jgi:hypothetical protein
VLTIVGIYGCTDATAIQTPGTVCFKIVSISAVAEWFLSLVWLVFILSVAHDIWYLTDVRETFFQHQGYNSVNRSDGDDDELQQLHHPTPLFELLSRSHSVVITTPSATPLEVV